MRIEEFQDLRKAADADKSISASELINQTDRTLLYGYNFDRQTQHTYLMDGQIHWYMPDIGLHISKPRWEEGRSIVPPKRVYPALSDLEFCKLLKSKDIDVSYANFTEADRGPFAGETHMDAALRVKRFVVIENAGGHALPGRFVTEEEAESYSRTLNSRSHQYPFNPTHHVSAIFVRLPQ